MKILWQFTLGHHTITVWKVMASCAVRHALVVRVGATTSLAYDKTLTAPDGATILLTLPAA